MADTLPFVLGPGTQGLPWTQSGQAFLQTALQGGPATGQFFAAVNALSALVSALNAESASWSPSTDGSGNPTWSCSTPAAGGTIAVTLAGTPQTDVIDGTSTPATFQWNGQAYNIVGTFTGTATFNDSSFWTIQVPIGLSSAVAVTALGGYAWSGLVAPLLGGFLNGVKSCFAQAGDIESAEAASAASEEAADEAAVEVEVEGAEVSLEAGAAAFVAIVIIVAVQYLVAKLDHVTYHNLQVYNLTPWAITWQPPFIDDDEAQMISMPVTGDGSGSYDFLIPGLSTVTPPGGAPVPVASEAGFAFASTSGFAGFAYVLPFQIGEVAAAEALFDLPWGAHNSLYGTFSIEDPQVLFEQWDGVYKQTQFATQLEVTGGVLSMTLTYDFISGEQTAPNGQAGYFYNSLLVFDYVQTG